MTIRGVWATENARDRFTEAELDEAVRDYNEQGPQYFTRGVGFAFYKFPAECVLAVAVRDGKATLMTAAELEEEQRKLRGE